MSNVLTEFVSLPPPESSAPRHNSLFVSSSQPLIDLVKRGMGDRKNTVEETIDLTERINLNGGQAIAEAAEDVPPEPEDSPKSVSSGSSGLQLKSTSSTCSSKRSCLKPNGKNEAAKHSEAKIEAAAVVSFEDEMIIDPIMEVGITDNRVGESATAAVLTMAVAAATATNSRLQLRHVQHRNERRRIFEDNLAAVCMGFVLVFLLCHVPRLLLNIHELITIKEAMLCGQQGHHPFSVWSMVTISVSHFLLVLNSATNILVYCVLSSKIREECIKIIKRQSSRPKLWRRRARPRPPSSQAAAFNRRGVASTTDLLEQQERL